MKRNFTKGWKLTAAEEAAINNPNLQAADLVQVVTNFGTAVRIYADAHGISYRLAESIISKEFDKISETPS